jgi:hypothetical protein
MDAGYRFLSIANISWFFSAYVSSQYWPFKSTQAETVVFEKKLLYYVRHTLYKKSS